MSRAYRHHCDEMWMQNRFETSFHDLLLAIKIEDTFTEIVNKEVVIKKENT